jgi:D-beta-D-heptose 7-phosphate kinase / D-beta-D-heptose 1-phosphate adenosyltransferase
MNSSVADKFLSNPALFHGKKILVAGDIALDRTFFCDPTPEARHAVHAGESILDVRPQGDDFGMIGAAYNACLLSAAVGADSALATLSGDDQEAVRLAELFAVAGTKAKHVRLPGVQTVTRLRFFVNDPVTGRFRLRLRVDKDPDVALSYTMAEAELCSPAFLDWWEGEAESSDAILFSDTGKGFLSRRVLVALDERTRRASARRVSGGKKPIAVVVDPKREWEKFAGLNMNVFKPNDVEASGAVQLPRQDWSVDANLKGLAVRIAQKYGGLFPQIVITLGEYGAALVSTTGQYGMLFHFPALRGLGGETGIAMHCGDMFAAALALSFTIDDNAASAIPFANYVASLQVSKPIGGKISGADLTHPLNIRRFRELSRPPRHIGEFSLGPEKGKI